MASTDPAFEPLDLVGEHLVEVSALWPVRRQVLFSKVATLEHLALLDRRISAHLVGLAVRPAESTRRARIRMFGPLSIDVFAGLFVHLHLDAAGLRGPSGDLRLARCEDAAIADAIVHAPAPPGGFLDASDRRLLDGAGASLPPEALAEVIARGAPVARRAALLGAARGASADPALLAAVEEALTEPHPGVAAAALYALGLLRPEVAARRIDGDLAGAAWLASAPCLGVVGTPKAAQRLLDRARDETPVPAILRTLGLLGTPAALPYFASILDAEDPEVADAATRAFHTITGYLFVRERSGEDQLLGDRGAAESFLRSAPIAGAPAARVHLGLPLDAPPDLRTAPLSRLWLHAVTVGPSSAVPAIRSFGVALRCERPDWLFGEGYGALSAPRFDIGLDLSAARPRAAASPEAIPWT